MARTFVILLLLTVTVATVGWILWRVSGAPEPPSEPTAAQSDEGRPAASRHPMAATMEPPEAARATRRPVGQPPRPGEIVPRASRDVTPPGMTRGPVVTGPLVRIPGLQKPTEERPPKPRLERLFKPVVDSAGSLTTSAGRLSIEGIQAPQLDATCGEQPRSWPCGRLARAELRRFIRGRAIECQVPRGAESLPETVRCTVAGADIGEWLVRQGWARPAGEAYAEAAREAEAERRGLWGDGER